MNSGDHCVTSVMSAPSALMSQEQLVELASLTIDTAYGAQRVDEPALINRATKREGNRSHRSV